MITKANSAVTSAIASRPNSRRRISRAAETEANPSKASGIHSRRSAGGKAGIAIARAMSGAPT